MSDNLELHPNRHTPATETKTYGDLARQEVYQWLIQHFIEADEEDVHAICSLMESIYGLD